MLNFKKGLAVVLAAATAFTFAPFANLGSVQAQAAESNQGYNMAEADFSGTVNDVSDVADVGSYGNATLTEGAIKTEFDGIWMGGKVTLRSNRNYTLSEVSSEIDSDNFYFYNKTSLVKVSKLGSFHTNSDGTVSAGTATSGDGNDTAYYFVYKLTSLLTSSKSASILFMDQNAINNTRENVTYTVTNKQNWDGSDNSYKVAILQKDTSGAAWTEAPHENSGSVNDQYNLTLNNESGTDYAVGVYTSGNPKTWTGMASTSVEVKATSTSGNIAWVKPDTSANLTTTLETTGDISYTTNGKLYYGGSSTTKKNLFYTTAANASNNTIAITYTLYNIDKSKSATDTSQVLNYVVDRSNNAVDWIKVGNTKITDFTTANWTVGSHDSLTYKTLTDMDPYINNSKTIIVKSESHDIQFISSDNTIVTVEKAEGKYYKATVTAKGPGTATVSIYVNGTTNNKGKVYNIPVRVAVNAIDAFTVGDSEDLLDKEAKDTIYLDAADQTAANAVKSDKLTIASKGGLKITNVKSSDSSVVSVDPSTNTITSKANIADLSTPKTVTISWQSVTDTSKHVSGNTGSINVVVWAKPRADFGVDPINLSLSTVSGRTKLLQTNPVKTNVVWTVNDAGTSDELGEDTDAVFTLTNTTAGNTQSTATVVARAFGKGSVKALVTETSTTRPTAKIATVTVGADNANVITSDRDSLVLTEGDTAQINAKATTGTVTFTSADPSIATVTTGGAVTAVKAGQTKITVSADGATSVVIPVIVAAKQAAVDTTTTPSKVTGVKVTNKKGGYVTVTWTKQNQKNIKYYVKKTVSGKSAGKSVNGNKTTLTVKKGATVKVKVKAYIYNASGKKLVGTYSKTVTKKTDKK